MPAPIAAAEIRETGWPSIARRPCAGFGCVAAPIRGAGRAIAAVSATVRIESIDVEMLAPRGAGRGNRDLVEPLQQPSTTVVAVDVSRRRSAEPATASSIERAASAELDQWLKYDDWL